VQPYLAERGVDGGRDLLAYLVGQALAPTQPAADALGDLRPGTGRCADEARLAQQPDHHRVTPGGLHPEELTGEFGGLWS
jgi:hypothetical protein